MDRWLQKEVTLRVLAVALALLLWMQVASERQRPEVQRVFENMQVSWRHLGDDLAVLDLDPSAVSIVVRGERSVMDYVSRHDFDVIVNLRGAGVGTTLLYVTATVPKGVQLVEFLPDVVAVHLEETSEAVLEPRVRLEGEPAPGFEAHLQAVQPSEVTVRGGRTAMGRVKRVDGFVDVTGQGSDFRRQVTLRVVDESGMPVPDVSVMPGEVTVDIEMTPVSGEVTVPVAADVTGSPAPGYRLVEARSEPLEIVLEGWIMDLLDVDEIRTQPIDISGLSSSRTFVVSLVMPDDTYSTYTGPVTVRVEIERAP